ncbi:MAG: hypothetical protein LBF24_02890 [Puniceicoccales bacterium]|jgi:tetratricopeptide (TPR) repeat protein|nr:hypothetical protein [Puniceicoccales bacterium]
MEENETDRLWRKNIEDLAEMVNGAVEELKEVGNLGDGIGITEEEKQQAYVLGYHLFQQKKYDRAIVIFRALNALDPLSPTFAKAYASALHMSGDRAAAAFHYLMAYFIHPEDLELVLLCGRCAVELGQPEQAYLLLNGVSSIQQLMVQVKDKKQIEVLRTFTKALREKLQKEEVKERGREVKKKTASMREG